MAMNLLDLLNGINAVGGGDGSTPQQPSADNSVSGLTVTAAPRPTMVAQAAPPTSNAPTQQDFNRSIYNNIPDQQLAKMGQQQSPHSGPVKGTLRNILGILGDAMLVQGGKSPQYAPWYKQSQEAQAMTGFQSDPRAAAGRLAAIPGAGPEADKMYDNYENESLRKAQLDATTQLRQSQQDSLNQYRQSQEDARKDQRDARLRQAIGGVLGAAATPDANGNIDTQKWAAARNQALKLGKNVSDFDPSEVPDDPTQYNSGYGQTARQVVQGQTSNASINERGQAAAQASQDRRRGQDMRNPPQPNAAAITQQLITKRNNGQSLTPAEQEYWDSNVLNKNRPKTPLSIPGLTPPKTNGGPPAVIPSAATALLKSDPTLRPQFDAKYGKGASAQILGN